jgi:hypothetical protein
MDQVTDQAVSVLNQAQQLAALIDEAMQSARDLEVGLVYLEAGDVQRLG